MVMDDANLELALEGCLWGGFGTTGQRCTAASRVIVHEKVHDRFVEQFVKRADGAARGRWPRSAMQMGPSISEKQLQKVMSYVEIGKQEGATIACGGRRLTSGPHANGFFHEPTVFTGVTPSMRIAREEIFGPVVSISNAARRTRRSPSPTTSLMDYRRRSTRRTSTAPSGDARHLHRNFLCQRADDRRRSASAVWRHEGHRQRSPRGRPRRARCVLGVEVDLRGLQRQAAARADRH